ncbi:hypothetical protein [Streptosporangium sp. NPDC002721]|uniref:hypothetical protein n=1 Tax=Streptosporangium sp. NPDC002721 TaxID=3366188 RepID=UPI0036AA0DAA
MPEPTTPCRAQIWAGRTNTRRRFLITTVLPNGHIRGMDYLEGDSATRTTTLTPDGLHTLYELLEDVPEHLRAASHV